MAPMSRLFLSVIFIAAVFAQDRHLQANLLHGSPTSKDCFLDCWKTPGFCLWCGEGKACCNVDGSNSPDSACKGVSFQGIDVSSPPVVGRHQCVNPAYLPGQSPPNTHFKAGVSDQAKAQCTAYMAQQGCDWTNTNSCPGQPLGSEGPTTDRSTVGYKCCCTNGLWQEAAHVPNPPSSPSIDQGQCSAYIKDTGCTWTAEYSCPGQIAGSKGQAGAGSVGYSCCCGKAMWKTNGPIDPNAGNANNNAQVDPTAFNVDSGVHNTGSPLIKDTDDNGMQLHVGAGQQVGNNVAGTRNGASFFNHDGPNIHTNTVQHTDPGFVSSLHHGPINNQFSKNDDKSKKERCVGGVCAPLLGKTDFGNYNKLPETQNSLPVVVATENKPKVLPSIVSEMNDGDKQPKMMQVTGAVSTFASPVVGGVMTPPAAPVSAAAAAPVPAPAVSASAPPIMNARVAEPAARAPAAKAPGAAAPAAATATVETTLSAAVLPGATAIAVASHVGFVIGDSVLVGGTEMKTVVAANSTITINPPMVQGYAVGTPVQKVPSNLAKPQTQGSSSMTSSSLSTSSAGYGWLVTLMLICCLCLGGGGVAAFIFMNKKQKKRTTTEREAYLKNDFIERQPVYDEAAAQYNEVEPMLKDQSRPMNHDGHADMVYTGADAVQAPVNPMQPTMQSFPVQVELAAPVYAAPAAQAAPVVPLAAAGGISFPGLPTIGGGSTLLQQQQQRQTFGAQPQAASMTLQQQAAPQYFAAQPQAASMNATMPYGNYSSQSAYVSAPTRQSQPRMYPGGGVV